MIQNIASLSEITTRGILGPFCLPTVVLILSLISCQLSGAVAAGDGLYVGLNSPGISVGYQNGRAAGEIRGFKENDVEIYGGRIRYNALQLPETEAFLYTGLDGFLTNFEGDYTEGDGTVAGIFAGLQSPLIPGLTLNIDIGPYHVDLKDDYSGLEESGFSYVLNLGLNVHFKTNPGGVGR